MENAINQLGVWLWGAGEFSRFGRPDVGLAFLGGLGDELLCTVPLVEWRQRGVKKLWLRTSKPELFYGLDRAVRILPDDPRYERFAARLGRPFRYLSYSRYEPEFDRDGVPPAHIIVEMCRLAGLRGPVRLRPHWYVSAAEQSSARRWANHVVIQTSTLTALVPMHNKQWPADRFQAVVDQFPGQCFLQLGSTGDPPLRGVIDLRGQTTLRESAAILHGARAFVGLVGFLMHLARAVECPAAIVYGGRETPALTGYVCNENITETPACSPCWLRSRCDHQRVCMTGIAPARVAESLRALLARPRGPLLEEVAEL